jgi:hypothetical protein
MQLIEVVYIQQSNVLDGVVNDLDNIIFMIYKHVNWYQDLLLVYMEWLIT